MKKSILNLFISAIISIALFSCSSSNNPGESTVVDKTSVTMLGASSGTFNVTASGDWTITVPKTNWLTVTPTSGSGNTSVTCTATIPNAYREKRQTNLSIFPTNGSSAVVAVKDSLPNTAPAAPASAVYPANGATSVNESAINLRWTPAIDPEGDRVYYNLQTSTDGSTWTTVVKNLSVPFYSSGTTLTANTKYYWRVQAVDLFGALSNYSATFSYTTATNASAWTDGEVRLYQNCINSTASDPFTLIVTGDGFTASDMAAGGNWDGWSNKAIQGLLGNIEPYKTWGNYLRIIRIANISQQSGISQHALTGDTQGKCNVVVNTKFGTMYDNTSSSAWCGQFDDSSTSDTGGSSTKTFQIIQNELTAAGYNITKNFAILLILNVSHYNGTVNYYIDTNNASSSKTLGFLCLSPGTIGTQTGFENVVCHEIGGHAIGHLADLYISSTGTLSSDRATQTQQYLNMGWYQNVSLTGDQTQCTWNFFFTNTTDHDTYYPLVGIYQGARSVAYGIWRPQSGATCMNDNRFEYDAPSRYSIIKQLKACVGETLTWADFVNKDYDRNNAIISKAFKTVPNAPRLPEPIVHFIHK